MRKFLASHKARWFTYSGALILAMGLILLVLMVETSSQPQFCGSCHIMAPYYESWKTSSHKEIPCVDCHIPPGVAHEVRKKWEALSMVVSYITGTYGTKPWTEIDDASCLRCHQRRLLSGQELFGDVLFDHGPHLTQMRQGTKLRCTSCHSQIVQGRHIAVTASSCILCHFKGERAAETSRCTLCHSIPKQVVEKGMLRFDHADVQRYDMKCQWCHASRLTPEDGRVPRERCFTCHNDPTRLALYEETDLMHRMHVTERKVDCLHCHLEIRHGEPLHADERTSQTECSTCHVMGHSPQRSLYAGTGGRGVPPMPAPMFLAGVACEGCHIQLPGAEQESVQATEISCMSCHGPKYKSVLLGWKRSVKERTDAVSRQLRSTASLVRETESQALADARYNVELVQKGRGIHNQRYAFALLSHSHKLLNDVRAEIGRPLLSVPWPEIPFESPCSQCHQDIVTQKANPFGRDFSHEVHVVRRELECAACHRPHEERTKGELLSFGEDGCANCHHQDPEADCQNCHSKILEKTVPSFRGDFAHLLHVELLEGCTDCHTPGAEKSHPVDQDVCAMCH